MEPTPVGLRKVLGGRELVVRFPDLVMVKVVEVAGWKTLMSSPDA